MCAAHELLLSDLDRDGAANAQERAAAGERTVGLRAASRGEIEALVRGLLQRLAPRNPTQDTLLSMALQQLAFREGSARGSESLSQDEAFWQEVGALYQHLGAESRARKHLLSWCAASRCPAALAVLAEQLAADPPGDPTVVAAVLSPLFQHRDYAPQSLFPRLLEGLAQASAASAVLDLANFLTREQRLPEHPARVRVPQLVALLGGVVGRLGHLESGAGDVRGTSADAVSRQVNDGVALAVSLCDALALIGDKSVTGKLYQTLDLAHRRLRTEAAAALAKLGEPAGVEALVALAAEPVARLRVLAYAEELGVLDRVAERYRTAPAQAEAEVALWLAQPSQMGVPPTECELVDTRCQYWPGYDEPVNCFLFRFTYRLGERAFSNIAIAGPLVHAFGADLSDLPPHDIYAAFAGWHAEHAEISEVDVEQLNDAQRSELFRLERRLGDEGYDDVQPLRLGSFFGDKVLIARALWHAQPGVAVADAAQCSWFPQRPSRRPLGPEEAYLIYKGRRLLRTFNR